MPWHVELDPTTRTLASHVSGILTLAEVAAWREALHRTIARSADRGAFRALMNIHGYEVADQERTVHAAMRTVIPGFLAEHGLVSGFWGLYEATPPAPTSTARCHAVAHVHHDVDKAARYDELLGTTSERFFSDPVAARAWLATVPPPTAVP